MPYIRSKKAEHYIKLYTDTLYQYHALNTFLDNRKFPHYIITPKAQRAIKVVIKGLSRDTKPTDIENDLIDLGFIVDRITQVIGNISRQRLPIFTVSLPRNLSNANIFDLKTLSNLSISIEGFDRKGATQCFKCNLFNHAADNCHLDPRCLKCGNEHQTRECQIVKVDSLYCINCQTYGHLANYSKCPLFPKPRKGTAIKPNYSDTINSIVRPNIFYAQITHSTSHSAAPQQMAPQVTPFPATVKQITQSKNIPIPTPLSGNKRKK
ncbi:nucleic-acid-binding protein from transposon X-element [Trichonephila clavipes]|nr:nucleic-acid-binding protein from transposon X-element [Trichonephila clavipes]